MKTLIVEDDFTRGLLLQELLQVHGPLHIAVNGREALDAVRMALEADEPYDLSCLYSMVSEMDGQEALREIRSIEESRGICSSDGSKIMMTAVMADLKNVNTACMNLCDAYLKKPIRKSELNEELRVLKLIP